MNWHLVFNNAWPIFLITTIYSYVTCGVVGTITSIKTNHNKTKIDEQIEKFIISPFYVATFFSLFCLLLGLKGAHIKQALITQSFFLTVLLIGLLVFVGHFAVELLEATFIRKNPLRIIEDKEAIYLSGIYLLLILMVSILVCIFN